MAPKIQLVCSHFRMYDKKKMGKALFSLRICLECLPFSFVYIQPNKM